MKEYRRLGVAGEDRFIGHGITFCATCDAPLFRDKRVAVIRGGNSAFTTARDLIPYAREIHIINILEEFQADPILINEVKGSSHVVMHPQPRSGNSSARSGWWGCASNQPAGPRPRTLPWRVYSSRSGLNPTPGR